MIIQNEIILAPYPRGFHLITSKIHNNLPALPETGLLQLFLKHTSAALCINENADPTVRSDFETFFSTLIPEKITKFKHKLEGSDDMPAHLKSSLLGQCVTIPITNHALNMGVWQGIYLCEFRNYGGSRTIVFTIFY